MRYINLHFTYLLTYLLTLSSIWQKRKYDDDDEEEEEEEDDDDDDDGAKSVFLSYKDSACRSWLAVQFVLTAGRRKELLWQCVCVCATRVPDESIECHWGDDTSRLGV